MFVLKLLLKQILRNFSLKTPLVFIGSKIASEASIFKPLELKLKKVRSKIKGQRPTDKGNSKELIKITIRWFNYGVKVFKAFF